MTIRAPQSGKAAKLALKYLQSVGLKATHQQCLELVARVNGFASWHAMNVASNVERFEPLLVQGEANEFIFIGEYGDSVNLLIENIKVYVKVGDEGVTLEMFPRNMPEGYIESLAGTYLEYAEIYIEDELEPDEELMAPIQIFACLDAANNEWYWSKVKGTNEAGPFHSLDELGASLLETVEGDFELDWVISEPKENSYYVVYQDEGDFQEFSLNFEAITCAKNMRDSGAAGIWTVETTDGKVYGVFLSRTGLMAQSAV